MPIEAMMIWMATFAGNLELSDIKRGTCSGARLNARTWTGTASGPKVLAWEPVTDQLELEMVRGAALCHLVELVARNL